MMRGVALLVALLCLGIAPASADPDPQQPYVSMRNLQTLQEQIAHGDMTAQAAQGKLMAHIAEGFLAADPDVWKDVRNSRAAILFLFSGGQPGVVRTILGHAAFPADIDRLLKGALAYGEGHDDIARGLLDPIDPQTLPASLGGHVALIKANLLAEQDPPKAIKLMDLARLLAPGTLIEEAALRREVFLHIDAGAIERAMLLSRQYMRRFRASSYAENFKLRFAAAAAKMAMAGNIDEFSKLDGMVRELPAAEGRSFYLSVAKSSIVGGKTAAARFAADKALSLATASSRDEARAKLYKAAALVVSDDTESGMDVLSGLDLSRLPPDDLALRDAALTIGREIRQDRPLDLAASEPQPANGAQAIVDRAKTALADADHTLGPTSP